MSGRLRNKKCFSEAGCLLSHGTFMFCSMPIMSRTKNLSLKFLKCLENSNVKYWKPLEQSYKTRTHFVNELSLKSQITNQALWKMSIREGLVPLCAPVYIIHVKIVHFDGILKFGHRNHFCDRKKMVYFDRRVIFAQYFDHMRPAILYRA